MDQWVGERLRELEESGAAENTIVFYFSDHGGALPRGKRNIHDTGTRVPLIIRFPEKWEHLAPKTKNDNGIAQQLVAFVDFPATVVNLCGLKIPDIWEGKPFLGPNAQERDFVYLYRGRMVNATADARIGRADASKPTSRCSIAGSFRMAKASCRIPGVLRLLYP